jgi:hypothetical protein
VVGMKRLFLSAFMFLCTYIVYAQSSICGIPFGQSLDVAERLLEIKFGEPYKTTYNSIQYEDIFYGGYYFDYARFCFQADINGTYFNECVFMSVYDKFETAKIRRESLKQTLSKSYDNLSSYKNKEGFICYRCGESPVNDEYYGIFVKVGKSKTGRYIVAISYGPYDYVKEDF